MNEKLFIQIDGTCNGSHEVSILTQKQIQEEINISKKRNHSDDVVELINNIEKFINNCDIGDHYDNIVCINTNNWISIEEELPRMKAMDLLRGGTPVRVYHPEKGIAITKVSDHDIWYYRMIAEGITHWYKE